MMREVEGAVTFSPAPGVRVVAVAAARVREWRRRSGESRAERRRGAADDDERSRRCLRLFTAPPPSPSPSPASPSLPPPSPFATVADALTVAPPLTTQPVAAAALFAAAPTPRLRLCPRPLAALASAFTVDLSPPAAPAAAAARRCRGIASAPSSGAEGTLCWRVCSMTSCYGRLILFGCLRVCAATQITLNSACVAKTRPPPMPLRRHSHPHHPSCHAQ